MGPEDRHTRNLNILKPDAINHTRATSRVYVLVRLGYGSGFGCKAGGAEHCPIRVRVQV